MISTSGALAPSSLAEKSPKRLSTVFVNGEMKEVRGNELTFDAVVHLAYPAPPSSDTVFTVTFRNGRGRPREGEMVLGDIVKIQKEGTAFDVTSTGKS